jgi:putative flippase GtrA
MVRFGTSGVAATGVHVATAAGLISILGLTPALANGTAFAVATGFSYLANTLWSFSAPLHGRTVLRFACVAAVGLLLAMAVSGAAEGLGLHYLLGILLVAATVPPVSFALHNFWTYRQL